MGNDFDSIGLKEQETMQDIEAFYKEGSAKQSYLIHGHIHNKSKLEYSFLNKNEHCLNAGVDVNDFEPKTLDELINIKLDKIYLDSSKSKNLI